MPRSTHTYLRAAVLAALAPCVATVSADVSHYPFRYRDPKMAAQATPIVRSPEWRSDVGVLVPVADGSILVIEAAPLLYGETDMQRAWRLRSGAAAAEPVDLPVEDANPVVAAVPFAGHALVGTEQGLLWLGPDGPQWLTNFVSYRGSVGTPMSGLPRVFRMAGDAQGNVWLTLSRWLFYWPHQVLPHDALSVAAERLDWDGKTDRLRMRSWEAPAGAIAGSPSGAGLWTYGRPADGPPTITRVGMELTRAGRPPPAPSALPQGVQAPAVEAPLLAADAQRHVYLAGDTLDGSKVFVFDGETIEECSPPADTLHGRRFTALVVDADNRLHAATDGVGVLVYDNEKWQEHPINEHLPTVQGTGLKPVTCMAFDRAGNLWVGMDDNVICWREEE